MLLAPPLSLCHYTMLGTRLAPPHSERAALWKAALAAAQAERPPQAKDLSSWGRTRRAQAAQDRSRRQARKYRACIAWPGNDLQRNASALALPHSQS